MAKTATISSTSSPEQIIATSRSVLEDRGYFWEPTGPVSATAHEGGKPVAGRATSQKLVVDLRADGGDLVLEQRTTGAIGFALNLGPLVAMRISGEFGKVRKALEKALR